ncbi:MAG: proton-conducting transporter membrane subunit [Anaerolineaceae bacterium]
MSAPLIWIGLPILSGFILWFFRGFQRKMVVAGFLLCALFALLALLLPLENVLQIGGGVRIESTMSILGRTFVLSETEKPILVLLYGFGTLWLFGLLIVPKAFQMAPYILEILGLLTASLAVRPFLYAALIIEAAMLISIPMFVTTRMKSTRGLMRFLIFLTMAIPFMLLAGWAANIAEANPASSIFLNRAAIFLALGFSFLLGVFPLFTWMPMVSEESNPYVSGFILTVLSVVVLFLGVQFLDTYGWLRTLFLLPPVFRLVGGLMVAIGGALAGFDRRIARLPAYITVMQNGLAIIAISLKGAAPLTLFAGLFIPRLVITIYLCMALAILSDRSQIEKGSFFSHPFTSGAILISIFSFAGIPLLAGFPPFLILLERLGEQSAFTFPLIAIGYLGLLAAGIRHFISMIQKTDIQENHRETNFTRAKFIISGLVCFLMGLLPGKIITIAETLIKAFHNWQ